MNGMSIAQQVSTAVSRVGLLEEQEGRAVYKTNPAGVGFTGGASSAIMSQAL